VEDKIKFLAKIRRLFLLLKGGVGILLLLLFLFALFGLVKVSALTVDSVVTVTVVSLPPPTGLVATASGPYQVDLSWSSTSGAVSYNIYRDNIVIASTTDIFYSDSGLAPGTVYTYNVSALDGSGIESGKSSSVQVTTQSLPSVEEEQQTGGALFIPPPPESPLVAINNNLIYTNSTGVYLNFFAKNAYQMIISNNPDFIGSFWEDYKTQGNWTLKDGDGEKKVFVKYRSFSGGVSNAVFDSIILDTTPPVNVSDFQAKAKDSQIDLKWISPSDEDFQEVVILRSETFYPSNLFEGVIVYKGNRTEFSDQGVKNGIRYYYTVFSFDKAGNFSSGAVISEVPNFSLTPGIPPEIPPEIPPTVPTEQVPYTVRDLKLNDFDFIQDGKKIPITNDKQIKVLSEKPLTVSIDYEKFREVLKTIMVTLNKDGKTFSFLLKVDGEKKKYLAVILPPEPRIYPFDIFIIDYKNQNLKKIPGEMIIRKAGIFNPEASWEKINQTKFKFPILWLIILFIFLTYIIRKEGKKRREKNLRKQEIEEIKKNSLDGLDNYFRKE
jgi:hypothetical protein